MLADGKDEEQLADLDAELMASPTDKALEKSLRMGM